MSFKFSRSALGLAMLTAVGAAGAFTVTEGNNPQPNQSNVLRNACGLPDATGEGLAILGCLNDNHSQLVAFASDESLQYTGGGQARIEASNGLYSQLSINAVGYNSQSVIFNLNVDVDGTVQFSDGLSTSASFAVDASGQNFFTVIGPVNTLSITTFVGGVETDIIQDTRQVRLSLASAVPEPQTYALMLAGLAVVGVSLRRRQR